MFFGGLDPMKACALPVAGPANAVVVHENGTTDAASSAGPDAALVMSEL